MSQHQIDIVDHNQLVKRVEVLRRRSDDVKARMAPTLKKLWHGERELASVKNLDCFTELRSRFSSFSTLIDIFETSGAGLRKLNLPFESVPILLQGPPGLGKTYVVSELAKAMEFPFFEISMATISASFVLAGGSLQWGEGSIGFIANTIAESPQANPIILIDEIDKLNGSQHYSPANVLYSLLEPHTAKRFKDEALELELDVSHVIWIATANYPERIPEPILSRMQVISIEAPDKEQMRAVIECIYMKCLQEKPYGNLLECSLPCNVMDSLSDLTPREVRIALDQACLRAIRAGRADIQVIDLPSIGKESKRVGFL